MIWDSMMKKYQGSTRIKRRQLQALRTEFELLHMKLGKSVMKYFFKDNGNYKQDIDSQ